MQKVKLYDLGNTYIGQCELPDFSKPVEVIIMGNRYFVYDKNSKKYKEGLNYFISELSH